MVESAEDDHFHWLASDGNHLSGSEFELRSALSSGALAAPTLVWRATWAEWLPANRVAELASAIPEANRESALKPRRDPAAVSPPAAPGEPERSSLAAVSAAARASLPAERAAPPPPPARARPNASVPTGAPSIAPLAREPQPAARDTLAPSSFGVIGAPRHAQAAVNALRLEAPASGAPSARGRAPLPTLSDESTVQSATATLRPPGAVPPPARGVPAMPVLEPSGAFSFEQRSAALTALASFGSSGSRFEPVTLPSLSARLGVEPIRPSAPRAAPAPQSEPTPDPTLNPEPEVPPETQHTPVEVMKAGRPELDSINEDEIESVRPARPLAAGRSAWQGPGVVLALSALCGALLVALALLSFSRARQPEPKPHASASANARTSAEPAPTPVLGCRLAVPPALIGSNIERSVPPYAIKASNESALLLGFAASKTKGVGLRVNPDTLDTQPSFEEDGKDAVRGVVPLTRSGAPDFFVDRDDKALRSAHTVDEIPPFTVGVSDAGFSRVVAGSASLVWPLDASAKITEPRAAAIGASGYGVTFRRGGQSGSVLLGFVTSDGAKKSELVEIPGAPKFLGTPGIAGSASEALVAFAGRDAAEAPWNVFVSLTTPGRAPGKARQLVSGNGGGAISPTISALAPDRWLVQWTEGSSGQYRVRVQSFSAALSPIGPAVLVSPKGANAGQGTLCAFAGGAAALFILTTAGHDELWGATLSCP